MKPPKCRLCEANHWNHEPHKLPLSLTFKKTSSGGKSISNSRPVERKVDNGWDEKSRDKSNSGGDKPRPVIQGNGLEEDRVPGGPVNEGVVPVAGKTPRPPDSGAVRKPTGAQDSPESPSKGFDRTAYQREYMRKWRKK